MDWDTADYLAAAILVGTMALTIALGWRMTRRRPVRLAIAAAAILVTALIWAELAVGIFD